MNIEFEKHLDTIANEFRENLPAYHDVISMFHTDVDGISSGMMIQNLLASKKKKNHAIPFNLEIPWDQRLAQMQWDTTNKNAIIFSDLGPSGPLLMEYAQKYTNWDFYLLDHHHFELPQNDDIPVNIYNANPTLFGLNGLKEIVGATLNYLFITRVDDHLTHLGWLAALGMGGDTLDHIQNYQSYNLQVIEEVTLLDSVEKKTGLCAWGGQYERVDKGLSMAILPYVPKLQGLQNQAKVLLESLHIEPKKKVEDLTQGEIERISEELDQPNLIGDYLVFPKKRGLLHYTFEHAQMVSILGSTSLNAALSMIKAKSVTQEAKQQYQKHIATIVQNLTTFLIIPKISLSNALLVDLTDKIPLEMWSDTGSFASINQIYDPAKILFIGGMTPEGVYKLSGRTTPEFIAQHHNFGVNEVIKRFTHQFGGSGGGHPLAAGMRLSTEQYQLLIANVELIIEQL